MWKDKVAIPKPSPINARVKRTLEYQTQGGSCSHHTHALTCLPPFLPTPSQSDSSSQTRLALCQCSLISSLTCLRHLEHCSFWAADLLHLPPWREPHHLSSRMSSANFDALLSHSWWGCCRFHSVGKWAHIWTHLPSHVTMQQNCSGFYQ